MTSRLTTGLLACPVCAGAFDGAWPGRSDDQIVCAGGHRFPVVNGIPRLFGDFASVDVRSIEASFSSEWSAFKHGEDRPWGQTVDHRRDIALRELDCEPSWLDGRLVLDAGCGAGKLSWILADWGAEVVAADVSGSVDEAQGAVRGSNQERIRFVQADLNRPPFEPESFDLVFSGGVLHHNRDTREALEAITPLVAPGGSIYVWLYRTIPGLANKVRGAARRLITPLPSPAQRAIFHPWTAQSMLRQELRVRTGRARADDNNTYREKFVTLLDHYTPRYRWEHTPDELGGWYRELGFENVRLTETGPYGFGVLATRAGAREPDTALAGVSG